MKKLLPALLALCASVAFAAEVEVTAPWVRGTVTGQNATAAYMTLTSKRDFTLIGATTPAAGAAHVHSMKIEGGVMKMRAVDGVDLPAGKAVSFAPGGYHIMLTELKKPLAAGDSVALTLRLQDRSGKVETLDVKAAVRSPSGEPTHDMQHAHRH
ncbi:MAG: copper chaperone PCu(A)C [Rhodocyclaceae bacterium]|nr:copper chaperone PCu(A)C [Rhodocyclaceae bacterium]